MLFHVSDPPAVGKVTVGLELEGLTGFDLFHNHMTVDPVMRLFAFESPPYRRLVAEFRRRIFEDICRDRRQGPDLHVRLGIRRPPRPDLRRGRYLRIDNTGLEPAIVARRIVEHFSLTSVGPP